MAETPKRPLGETLGQLLVIAILIGLLIGAIILLEEFIHSHANSDSSGKSSFGYACCTGFNTNLTYHPGELLHVTWTPIENPPSANSPETLTLTAFLSNSFATLGALKSSTETIHFSKKGGFPASASAQQFHVSNASDATVHMSIRIPENASNGFYNLVTVISEKVGSSTSGSVIKVRR
jgi:hypothetical protein